jgi:hypothetical protein
VLVYQNLFAAADANVSVAQQVELGDLLTAADSDGFQIRVAIIATPADLGAITALWDKPASYARFLGVELSLAYAQRLLVVMPDGFGFNWQGHSTAAAYRVLGKLPIGRGGNGLAAAAETAVRALASASGVRLAVPASGGTPSANAASGAGSGSAGAGTRPASGGQPAAAPAPSGLPVPLIVAIAAGALAAVALGGWLARRAGLRLPAGLRLRIRPVWRRPPESARPRRPPCQRRGAATSASAPASRGCTCSSRPGTRRSPASAASSTRSTPTSPPLAAPACPG